MRFSLFIGIIIFLCTPVHAQDDLTLPFKVLVEIVETPDAEAERQKERSVSLEALSYERAVAEATEDMRNYAFYALVVSIISAVLLLYTLYLNGRAASAAAAAAKGTLEANKIARDELRPWITLERDAVCEAHFTERGLTISWNYNFSNLGKMPAYDVRLHCKAIKRQHFMGLPEEVAEFSTASVKRKDYFRTPIIFPGRKTDFLRGSKAGLSYLPKKEPIATGTPMLLVCITYRLEQAGDRHGIEGRIFQFDKFDITDASFQARMLEHSEARFIL